MAKTITPASIATILLVAVIDTGSRTLEETTAIHIALLSVYLLGFVAAVWSWWRSNR